MEILCEIQFQNLFFSEVSRQKSEIFNQRTQLDDQKRGEQIQIEFGRGMQLKERLVGVQCSVD